VYLFFFCHITSALCSTLLCFHRLQLNRALTVTVNYFYVLIPCMFKFIHTHKYLRFSLELEQINLTLLTIFFLHLTLENLIKYVLLIKGERKPQTEYWNLRRNMIENTFAIIIDIFCPSI